MVHITDVYNKQSKTMQYVYISEEWLTVTSYDYIRNMCPEGIDENDLILKDIEMQYLTHEPSFDNYQMNNLPEDIAELLFDCLTLFIREWCKYTGDNFVCRLDSLPNELYDQVTREYSHWLAEKELDPVTDGYKIILHPQYVASIEAETPNGTVAKELQQYLPNLLPPDVDTDHVLYEEFIHEKIQIIAGGKLFTFDIGADIYNGLCSLVNTVIDEQ